MKKRMVEKDQEISIKRQCELLTLVRSTYYSSDEREKERDLEIMNRIDEIFLEDATQGSRKIAKALQRKGFFIGRKKVRRLMRRMGIEAIYPRKKINLSVPGSGHKIYPYLLKNKEITKPNQVWCADITYIRIEKGFGYLVAIMDWVSRKVLSWKLSNTVESDFCVEALKEAIQNYGPPEIFNTDQGSQFTSQIFTQVNLGHGVKISMDGKGRFMDNIFIERLWRTLKYEEVYLNAYESLEDCRKSMSRYFERYNSRRLHQSLNYRTPNEYYYGIKAA